jgi:hypothetical protein
MVLILLACTSVDPNLTTELPPVDTEWVGQVQDEGFGATLAASATGDVLVTGAPWAGGRVYALESGGAVSVALDGTPSLGVGLAVRDGVQACAPADGQGCSGRVRALPQGLAVLRGDQVRVDGQDVACGVGRMSDVASMDGALVCAGTRDRTAVATSEGQVLAQRTEPGDGLGHVLCASDLNGDGTDELVVGAPGLDQVWIWTDLESQPTVVQGSGRFGQDVACGKGMAAVGAPLHGDGGAAWVFEGDPATWSVQDPVIQGSSREQLGASVLIVRKAVFVGAPGTPTTTGRVLRIQ